MPQLITPFGKQCFVTIGVALNVMMGGMVNAFGAVLIPQLRKTKMALSSEQESWIVSITGVAVLIDILIVPTIMSRFGRKLASCISSAVMTIAWFSIMLAKDYHLLLFLRFCQGFSMGITSIVAPVLIGEYTSPKFRGAFLTTLALSIGIGVLVVHFLGSYLHWKKVALICSIVSFVDFVIIACSPESPSFLAHRNRYKQCRTAFRWLRGLKDDEELENMITSVKLKKSTIIEDTSGNILERMITKLKNMVTVMKKKEFYKPIIIMFHLHLINEYSIAIIMDAYATDVFKRILHPSLDISIVLISTDIQRIISNFCAIIVIRYVKRRIMLVSTISLNIISYLLTAGYVYAKTYYNIPFDHPFIGIFLIHLHVFSIATGNLPLPNIISGEIFPLEHRGTCSTISLIFFCVNLIVNTKTALHLFATIGLYGAYCIYAGLVAYALVVVWFMLPETKDRTLLDIEEEFRGEPLTSQVQSEKRMSQELMPNVHKEG